MVSFAGDGWKYTFLEMLLHCLHITNRGCSIEQLKGAPTVRLAMKLWSTDIIPPKLLPARHKSSPHSSHDTIPAKIFAAPNGIL
jgi:hypothetical protein